MLYHATRMRNASILIVRLKGVATEAIKNIVLAGIGKLVIVDDQDVSEEDLGAGFFFRDEDVGKKRVDAAKTRIESLNSLVTVEALAHHEMIETESLEALVMSVDLVCVTDWNRAGLIRINDLCRRHKKPFYAGGSYGLLGYIFCDLLEHSYITPDRSAPKEAPKNVKATATYPPLRTAIGYRWSALNKRQTKELKPAIVFMILAIWEYEFSQRRLPNEIQDATCLQTVANTLLSDADVNKQVITTMPQDLIETMTTTAAHEFSPVCAVVGGMLAQDILKALAAREPPIANFFSFDGNTGSGTVCRLDML